MKRDIYQNQFSLHILRQVVLVISPIFVGSIPIYCIIFSKIVNFKFLFLLTTGLRHGVKPHNGIPGFSLHFPKEISYGYLRFEGKLN